MTLALVAVDLNLTTDIRIGTAIRSCSSTGKKVPPSRVVGHGIAQPGSLEGQTKDLELFLDFVNGLHTEIADVRQITARECRRPTAESFCRMPSRFRAVLSCAG